MRLTTIRVPVEVRDRLEVQAKRHGRTPAGQLAHLLSLQERDDRFAQAKEAMRRNPPDAPYFAEAQEWSGPGWL